MLYEVAVTLSVYVEAEDEKAAEVKGRGLVEQGCGRKTKTEIVWREPPVEPQPAA